MQDGLDFEPLDPSSLLPQHFSAIAAAGPIVGPILAGLTFGWLPALIWILVGSHFHWRRARFRRPGGLDSPQSRARSPKWSAST